MSGYTPGPWHPKRAGSPVDGEYDWGIGADINGKKVSIAEAFGRVGNDVRADAMANATLISAAPDLLEAALALLPADFDAHPQDFMPDWHALRAAVAKARGEQP